MSPRIKEEDLVNDGRWTILPDVGSVRTGPRGRRFWDFMSQERDNGQSGTADNLDQDGHNRYPSLTHHETTLMARFDDVQRGRRQNPDDAIGPIGSNEAPYGDSRRAPKHNRPVKRIKDEHDDESVLFCGENTVRQLSPPRRRPPTPPPTPPEPFGEEEETPLPSPKCKCPIHLECGVKEAEYIDCRRLVPFFRAWRVAQQGYVPPG